jgi:hypothetical protein
MFFRVVTGIRDHFEARVTEWIMGASLTYYGLGLVGEGDFWTNPKAWAGMTQYMGENGWGWLCVGLGLGRLAALAINGTFADTVYSRYSPLVRGFTAIASAAFWFMVILSVSAVASAGSRIYPLPLVLELWCVFHAWRDTGRAKAARNGMAH